MPPALASAISGAEDILKRYQTLADVMTATAIPLALSQETEVFRSLGSAEINGDAIEPLRNRLDAIQKVDQSGSISEV